MSTLIPIRENADGSQAVSGRELHAFLELGRDYTTWFKKMTEYGLVEGVDYLPISGEVVREGRGSVVRLDHALTIDAAKEIAMLQRTPRGKEARLYFIEVEKRARAAVRIPGTYAEALEAAAAEARRADALEARVAEDAPKVAAYDALIDADGYYSMESVAKLGGIGRTTLFRRLREEGVIQQDSRLPYQRYMAWFKITTAPWGNPATGPSGVSSTARVRPEALTKVLAKAGVSLEAVRS